MPFDIDKIGAGEWFPFRDSRIDENGEVEWLPVESDEKVCFKQVSPDRFREINDKYKGKKINHMAQNPATRSMELVVEYEQSPAQEKASRMEFWDEAIVDWDIKTPDGEQIPCNAENKYKLVTGDQRFLRYANKCLQLISGVKEDEEKNF